ncbi:ribonuclease domain-containing protein [Gordonia aichiensis]|uniref:Putative guanyl-specific ribonuclease n=1 Tax=Gordonia aichiensis NBRC 108223 TaxID=1220583 RepID=L7KGP2_9ACTN|nr:ribonuclease domain-containing protein [Gordonia aichiensis]GAC47794.1 putative guanyl-specific ribonuclease [Gordonia aichiensis NBRC 108223]
MSARKPTVAQRRRQAVLSALGLVVIGLVVLATWLINDSSDDSNAASGAAASSVSTSSSKSASAAKKHASATRSGATTKTGESTSVPPRVTRTLSLIDAGSWPPADSPGTKGGTNFGNFEGRLPKSTASGKRITYTEWDVNRREPGRGRDAERIVTGSDGSAWYTADHYNTFVEIRGPDR